MVPTTARLRAEVQQTVTIKLFFSLAIRLKELQHGDESTVKRLFGDQ